MGEQYYAFESNFDQIKFFDFKEDLRICKQCGCVVYATKIEDHMKFHKTIFVRPNDEYNEG